MWKENGINILFDCKVESFGAGWWRCGWIGGIVSFIGRTSWKFVKSQGKT
jgi:hypothetical protein